MSTGTVIVLLIVIVAIAAAVFIYMQKARSKRLRSKYGPEYDRIATEFGSTRRAESDLERREKRLEKIPIRALTNDEQGQFAEAWREVQASFVDNPAAAVSRADGLVGDLMKTRGYPVGDFEQRAADVSVDHPRVVESYHAAHAIAVRRERGEANTEDLRSAMVHYRALFEDLLEQPVTVHEEVHR
jgi:hypothetical protein